MDTSARNTVNIEETFALIVRRVVEARRLAAGGSLGGMEERRTTMMSLGGASSTGMETRRAMTAPLSPLPGGLEKVLSYSDVGVRGWEEEE